MSTPQKNKLVVENARIIFRNFAGKKSKYNREGNRHFSLVIEDEAFAQSLLNEGWNIKSRQPLDGQDKPLYYTEVGLNFDSYRPPKVILVTKHKKTILDEHTINVLDYADIKNVDIVINPYHWEVDGPEGIKRGIKGYVETLYVTIVEDEFADKYAEIPDDSPESIQMPFDLP